MNRRHVALGGIVVLVLVVGLGAAYFAGVGPAPGGSDSDEPITDFPTATAGDGTADNGDTETTEAPAFSFTVDQIEECGQTCRDVTATLYNNQEETATGVMVYTRIFAGRDNTDPDDAVWEGTDEVGTLEAGASHTTTKRVELSFQEGLAISRNDGWVTILTTVESNEMTVTFRDSEQVA